MIKIKGTSYYQDTINNLSNTCIGVLTPETDNEFDVNAMAIFVNGSKVGYLQKGWMYEPWGTTVIKQIKFHESLVRIYKINAYRKGYNTGLRLVFTDITRYRG